MCDRCRAFSFPRGVDGRGWCGRTTIFQSPREIPQVVRDPGIRFVDIGLGGFWRGSEAASGFGPDGGGASQL